jgi:hypothetical protein
MSHPRLETMAGRKARLVLVPVRRRRRHERDCSLWEACSSRGDVDCRVCVKMRVSHV